MPAGGQENDEGEETYPRMEHGAVRVINVKQSVGQRRVSNRESRCDDSREGVAAKGDVATALWDVFRM
jgi:hypothetical protein